MPYSKAKAIFYRNIIPSIISVSITSVGCMFIYNDTVNNIKRTAKNENTLLLTQLESELAPAVQVTKSLSHLLNQDCEKSYPIIKNQLLSLDSTRTLAFVNSNNEIYCSSRFKNYNDKPITFTPRRNSNILLLNETSYNDKRTPIIRYISDSDKGIIFADLDAKKIISLISADDTDLKFFVIIDNNYIDNGGNFSQTSFKKETEFYSHTQKSIKYPFYITTGYPNKITFASVIKHNRHLIILIFIASVMAGFLSKSWFQYMLSPSFEIKQALRQNEFTPYIQPIVDAKTKKTTGVEILARWKHPRNGLIPPDYFIPLAEKTGMIKGISRQLMKKTAKAFLPYKDQLPDGFHISFNISAIQFKDNDVLNDCLEFMQQMSPSSFTLTLELTERELIAEDDSSKELLSKLHDLGIKIALDDFGIGHSSLAYLNYFKIDLLKIDKIFVSKVRNDTQMYYPILDTIIDLSHKFGFDTVAEGVETELQVRYLQGKNVSHLQGYYFGKPVTPEDFFASPQFKTICPLSL